MKVYAYTVALLQTLKTADVVVDGTDWTKKLFALIILIYLALINCFLIYKHIFNPITWKKFGKNCAREGSFSSFWKGATWTRRSIFIADSNRQLYIMDVTSGVTQGFGTYCMIPILNIVHVSGIKLIEFAYDFILLLSPWW